MTWSMDHGVCVSMPYVFVLNNRFVQSCTNLLLEGHISVQLFGKELLEAVVLLATDPIPNVRLAVARILKQVIIANGTLSLCRIFCLLN